MIRILLLLIPFSCMGSDLFPKPAYLYLGVEKQINLPNNNNINVFCRGGNIVGNAHAGLPILKVDRYYLELSYSHNSCMSGSDRNGYDAVGAGIKIDLW